MKIFFLIYPFFGVFQPKIVMRNEGNAILRCSHIVAK
jgi:hypothetical protein